MPDFQQFADEMRVRLDVPDEHDFGNEKMIATAERHARLLQAVWEWATDGMIDFDSLNRDETARMKAHVRSLLQSTEERTYNRDRDYHTLMDLLGAQALSPDGSAMFALHQRVIRILDGQEPDPRQPTEEKAR